MRLAIIVPCLNEAERISASLTPLQSLRRDGHEVIVVDGQSKDETARLAAPLADQVITSQRGRALQMNAGAAVSAAEVLLFLHADTQLPAQAVQSLREALAEGDRHWGRFDVQLSGGGPWLRLIAFMMNWRSRISGIATGDQAVFVRRALFEQVGGFPAIDLMEDIALSRLLKRYSRPACLKQTVITSSRRWEQQGVWRTITLMWRLRLAYFFGVDPARLKRRYYS